MGSKLTPRKIDRLMRLANGENTRQFLAPDCVGNLTEQQVESITAGRPFHMGEFKSSGELSSGILDLEHCEGFGDSCGPNISGAFNPGEMTGRSTEAGGIENLKISESKAMLQPSIDDMIDLVNKQTSDINELMRHSISREFAPRDLTADEESFVIKNGILPVMPNKLNLDISKNMDPKEDSQISYGSYFKKGCPMLQHMSLFQANGSGASNLWDEDSLPKQEPVRQFNLDISLDNVPVRQSRPTTTLPKPTADNQLNLTIGKSFKPPAENPIPVSRKQTVVNSEPVNKCYNNNPLFVDPTRQHLQPLNEESSQDDTSFSITDIATFLSREKEVRPSNVMKQLKRVVKKPLKEINNIIYNQQSDDFVAMLQDKRSDTGSSTASTNTVISVNNKTNLENIPEVPKKEGKISSKYEHSDWAKISRSNSPCSGQENLASNADSPNRSAKSHASMVEEWVEIKVEPVTGFVGITTNATITVNSLTKTWLSATIEFVMLNENELSIDLPKHPLNLTPKSSNKIAMTLKPHYPIKSTIQFCLKLKDAYGCMEVEQFGNLEVDIKLPTIQMITNEGNNCNIKFATTQENTVLKKMFVLTSECPGDLLLDLVLLEGAAAFAISQVQEIKESEIMFGFPDNKTANVDEPRPMRQPNTKTCKIPSDGAVRIMVTFTAPQLSELQLTSTKAIFNGLLGIYLNGSGILLRNIEMCASVGTVDLTVELSTKALHINDGTAIIKIGNMGSIPGKWALKFKEEPNKCKMNYFQLCTNVLELNPGTTTALKIHYIGPEDKYNESHLLFEDTTTKKLTMLQISAGQKVHKSFPIKTTLGEMCWVRDGRKDISLRNFSDKRVTIKCKVTGNGFYMETSKANCTDLLLMFGPHESRNICVIFKATSVMPHRGKLIIFMENENEIKKNVRLHACAGGSGADWRGMLTYGGTALLKATARQPLHLTLKNTSLGPAFISVAAKFNLQFTSVQFSSSLRGDRAVIAGQSRTKVTLILDWSRVERIASGAGGGIGTVVTLSVLTGAEYTRQRILRILKQESNGELAVSELPEHLKRLTGTFEGEDSRIDETLQDFQETTKSLDVLLGGIKELTAHVDLPEDFGDYTICLTEDTILEHHTLRD